MRTYESLTDEELVKLCCDEIEEAKIELLSRYQNFIFNVSLKMVLSPFDAEDATQEILFKVITNVTKYKGKSKLKTWVYRIAVNHLLTMQKKWLEERYSTFNAYEVDLDLIAMQELTIEEKLLMKELVEEARLSCLAGMLLCLSREQRIIYILGEIFGVDHEIGSQVLGIEKNNFRQRLRRARNDLHQFMHKKCGLVNPDNPCRCPKKTKGFIEAGWVDPSNRKFNVLHTKKVKDALGEKDKHLKKVEDDICDLLQKNQPYHEKDMAVTLVKNMINSETIKSIFNVQ